MARKPAKSAPEEKTEIDEFLDEDIGPSEEEEQLDAQDETGRSGEPEPAEESEEGESPESEDEGQTQDDERRQKTVPLAALDEERHKRKDLQKQLDEIRSQNDQLRATFQRSVENFAERLQSQQQPQQQEPAPPDPDNDPYGHLDYRLKGLESQQPDPQVLQRQELINNVITTAQTQFEAFKADHPESQDALSFLRQARLKEFQAMGMDDATAAQEITNDELNVAINALRAGKNVGQTILNLAAARGFQADQSRGQKQESSGKQDQTQTASEKLRAAEQASRQASAARPGGEVMNDMPMGLDELAKIEEGPEFDKQFKRIVDAAARRERRGTFDDDIF